MGNINIEDIKAYMDYCDTLNTTDPNMDLDEINDSIEKLEDFKGKIDTKLVELQQTRALRLKNVKMLRKVPKKLEQIAC